MLIIAIAWLYVVLMMALTETSFIAGVATFLFYGVFPLSIVLYLLATPRRWRQRRQRETTATESLSGSPGSIAPSQAASKTDESGQVAGSPTNSRDLD